MVHHKDLEANQFVIPGSNYHVRMTAQQRFRHLFDGGEYAKVPVQEVAQDPLKFRDGRRYTERLKTDRPTRSWTMLCWWGKAGWRAKRSWRLPRTSASWAARSAWQPARP
jgi:hypothetical protein